MSRKFKKGNSLFGKAETKSDFEKLRERIEKEFTLEDYSKQGINRIYAEYLEITMQYGFVLMFAISFPLAPFLALLNNVIGKQQL